MSRMNMSLFLVLISGLLFLSLLSLYSSSSVSNHPCPFHTKSTSTVNKAEDELEQVLARASMGDKTVIIGVVNKAYVEAAGGGEATSNMLDLFLEGLWSGEGTRELLKHLIMVAVDDTAYQRCLFRGLHCYRLPTHGPDLKGEQVYMSSHFINMMWTRTLFLLRVLTKGYSFIFTDVDMIWLRNPFTILRADDGYQELDIQFSTDYHNGNSSSPQNPINTGFYYVKSNHRTISLFRKWYGSRDNFIGLKEQDVLQNMTWNGILGDLGLRVQFLDTRFFSGFCQESPDAEAVVTVHANCCRYITAKVKDLTRALLHWIRSRDKPPINQTNSFQWPNHTECLTSWN